MKKISKIISAMLVFAMLFQAPCAWIFHIITEKSILKR